MVPAYIREAALISGAIEDYLYGRYTLLLELIAVQSIWGSSGNCPTFPSMEMVANRLSLRGQHRAVP